jgi:hypothetical protein
MTPDPFGPPPSHEEFEWLTNEIAREQEYYWTRFAGFATLHAGLLVLVTSSTIKNAWIFSCIGIALGLVWLYVQWASSFYVNRFKPRFHKVREALHFPHVKHWLFSRRFLSPTGVVAIPVPLSLTIVWIVLLRMHLVPMRPHVFSMTILASDFSWLWSPKDYWYAIVSALIGAFIGILWTLRHFAQQQARHRVLCLSRLRACLEFNLERLNQARGQLAHDEIPNYPLDTAQLNHWLTESHDFIPQELLRNLDWQRFQLDHISSRFIVANSAVVNNAGNAIINPAQQQYYAALVESLATHVDTALNNLPPLLQQIPQ